MRTIILNADDFGRSESRNRAIDDSFRMGLIKSAGLIVTGVNLQDAINYIDRGGYWKQIHCHFNLSGNLQGENTSDAPLTASLKKCPEFCCNGMFNQYRGLPYLLRSTCKWRAVYKELIAQYDKFKELTKGKGNYSHVDFHLWYNLTFPVAIALNVFTWTHPIKSIRYIGVHQQHTKRRIFRILSWNPFVKFYHSGNIDHYLAQPESFGNADTIELYCHPDYINGVLMDNSISNFGHEKKSMEEHITSLKQYEIELISWNQ